MWHESIGYVTADSSTGWFSWIQQIVGGGVGGGGGEGSVIPWVIVTAILVTIPFVVLFWRQERIFRRLRRGAERFAAGELDQRLPVTGSGEMAALADMLNRMAAQLDDRMRTLVGQRSELVAVLASMREGVMALDPEERVMWMNRATIEILELDPLNAIGRSIQEVVRNIALQEMVRQTLLSDQPVQEMIQIRPKPTPGDEHLSDELQEKQLQSYGVAMRDTQGQRLGVLIVFHDVTRLRRLEVVRRDFVANASHEIKTPVAAIKMASETLMEESAELDPQLQKFLQIIHRQSERLQNLSDDLLNLARIEQDADQFRVGLTPGRLAPVLHNAVESCRLAAQAKRMNLEVVCPPDLEIPLNEGLMERAVLNLVDNAIKYCPEATTVRLQAIVSASEAVISVHDQGAGIEPEHQTRIFERFYRVDRARSRQLGGTGLGLAIVKHIALIHHGKVTLESTLGKGSTFRIHLPKSPPSPSLPPSSACPSPSAPSSSASSANSSATVPAA